MKWTVLEKIADADSISTAIDNGRAIAKVCFKINGAEISAQFDPDNIGVYGISVEGCDMLTLLGLDENGDPI